MLPRLSTIINGRPFLTVVFPRVKMRPVRQPGKKTRAGSIAAKTAATTVRRATDRERLAWALQFAQEDLNAWRPGDWLNALEDLRDLVQGGSDAAASALPLPSANSSDPAEVRSTVSGLQATFRDFLKRLEQHWTKDGKWKELTVPFSGRALIVAGSQDRQLQIVYAPTSQDLASAVLFRLGDLLTRVDLSRLQRCRQCRRFFIATKRQLFDTPQCILKARKKRREEAAASSR